jgi:hypothetical protein
MIRKKAPISYNHSKGHHSLTRHIRSFTCSSRIATAIYSSAILATNARTARGMNSQVALRPTVGIAREAYAPARPGRNLIE